MQSTNRKRIVIRNLRNLKPHDPVCVFHLLFGQFFDFLGFRVDINYHLSRPFKPVLHYLITTDPSMADRMENQGNVLYPDPESVVNRALMQLDAHAMFNPVAQSIAISLIQSDGKGFQENLDVNYRSWIHTHPVPRPASRFDTSKENLI